MLPRFNVVSKALEIQRNEARLALSRARFVIHQYEIRAGFDVIVEGFEIVYFTPKI